MNYDFEIKLTTNKLQDIIINDFNKKKKNWIRDFNNNNKLTQIKPQNLIFIIFQPTTEAS